MRLEVLYFDGCPAHARLMPALPALADEHDAQVTQRRIDTPEQADEARFSAPRACGSTVVTLSPVLRTARTTA